MWMAEPFEKFSAKLRIFSTFSQHPLFLAAIERTYTLNLSKQMLSGVKTNSDET